MHTLYLYPLSHSNIYCQATLGSVAGVLCHYDLNLQLCREFTHSVGSSVQISFDIIVDWATKFKKVLKIQDKSKCHES